MTGQPAISLRGVGKAFGTHEALSGITFDIAPASFVSVVGPSGCGKSTLLSIVAGLTEASSGTVMVDGEVVRRPAPRKVAVVFQDALLLPWKTVIENIAFPLGIQGVPGREAAERSRRMLELVGLNEYASHFPHQLSGGMRQRVSIARGLAQDPSTILMDEPFGALDEQTRIKMGQELLRIWDASCKTVLFITHSLTEALFLSDVVLVMGRNPGRIIERMDVAFPRPRRIELMGTPEFGQLRNRLWGLLNTDGDVASAEALAL